MATTGENASAPALDALGREVRSFFDEVLPVVLDGVVGTIPRAKAWRAALFDHGLAALDYPVAFGGRGLDSDAADAFRRLSRGLIPREDAVFGIGVGMAMPTLRDDGGEELQRRFLRPGLRGEEIWCQMYSEPGSGSDLAALTTRADWTATSGSSRVRRSGRRVRSTAMSRSCWRARTGTRPSTTAPVRAVLHRPVRTRMSVATKLTG
jgi:hypothetical protein